MPVESGDYKSSKEGIMFLQIDSKKQESIIEYIEAFLRANPLARIGYDRDTSGSSHLWMSTAPMICEDPDLN